MPGWDASLLTGLSIEQVTGWRPLLRKLRSCAAADVVVVDGWKNKTALVALIASFSTRMNLVVRTDTTNLYRQVGGLRWQMRRRVLRTALARAAAIAYVSNAAKQHLLSLRFDEGRLVRLPYTTDVDSFRRGSATVAGERGVSRAALGFADEELVAIAVLKLNEREGVMTLLDALDMASRTDPRLRLLLIGDGPLNAQVAAHPAAKLVRAVGYRPFNELPRFYALADVFVHPAPEEPWGVSVVEAFACGLPVILSDGVGAARELLVDRRNGYGFAAGDAVALASALCAWAALPTSDKAAMNAVASKSVATFEYDFLADRLVDLAKSLSAKPSASPESRK
jgi:glycosyltransferase involved in cell wall biosynthesis